MASKLRLVKGVAAAAALSLISTGVVAEQSAPDYALICTSCHGEGGVSQNPLVPTLAGQPYSSIEDNLLLFRAGRRACSPGRNDGSPAALLAQTMCETVTELTDDQISALAAYFEQIPFRPARQEFDATLAERGAEVHKAAGCEECHSDGGRETNAIAPILAGQWTPYLRNAMSAIREGSRSGPEVMNAAIRELAEDEVEALLHYYASQATSKD